VFHFCYKTLSLFEVKDNSIRDNSPSLKTVYLFEDLQMQKMTVSSRVLAKIHVLKQCGKIFYYVGISATFEITEIKFMTKL